MSQVKTSFWEKNSGLFLGLGALALLVALLFARVVFPELTWVTTLIVIALLIVFGLLIKRNHVALRSRTAAYGLNSLVTILLVFGLLGVVNFMVSRYPQKVDLTRNKLNTLSDQTVKLVKGLKQPVKATMFSKAQQKEQFRPLLDNYKSLNPKFEVEYVDPDREPTRAKTAGIKKYGTLELQYSGRDSKVEEPNEEKLTNALIKLTKDRTPTLCAITGHGEKNFSSSDAEGYSGAKQALANQSYEVKDLNIVQEQNKIPATCDAIAILGPTKAFFQPEIQAIHDYLNAGGRAVIAVDINLQGAPFGTELLPILASWNIKADSALIVDPLSRMLGVDASVPIVADFNRQATITKDFQGNCYFPFVRPLQTLTATPGITAQWLAKSTAKSWGVTDLKSLAKGQAQFVPGKDLQGPLVVAATAEGKAKDSKATRNTRLVVFGTSFFATNNFARYGGNMDFFLNGVSWAMEDESMISIRAKEEGPSKVELTARSGGVIFLLTVILVPLVIAVAGVVIWIFRRRL